MKIKTMILRENAILPSRGSAGAAGWDIYACLDEPVSIKPGETQKIPAGIVIRIPAGHFGAVYPRSGLASKQGLRLANCVGVIDEDYTGELFIPLHNDSAAERVVAGGERIAQLIVQAYSELEFDVADELESTERGDGGFGSTDNK